MENANEQHDSLTPELPLLCKRTVFFRLIRFNLRLLLLGVFVFCAWLAWHVNRTQKQRAAVKAIRDVDGLVYYDFEFKNGVPSLGSYENFIDDPKSIYPEWMIGWFGHDFFHTVVEVNLISDIYHQRTPDPIGVVENVSPEWLVPLGALPGLRKLSLKGNQISDITLASIGELNQLQELSLIGTNRVNYDRQDKEPDARFSSSGMSDLAAATNLIHISIWWCNLDDQSVKHIATLPNLTFLKVQGNSMTDEGARHLSQAKKLEFLAISHGGEISDDSADHLGKLTNLKTLFLQSEMSDDAWQRLDAKLTKCNLGERRKR